MAENHHGLNCDLSTPFKGPTLDHKAKPMTGSWWCIGACRGKCETCPNKNCGAFNKKT